MVHRLRYPLTMSVRKSPPSAGDDMTSTPSLPEQIEAVRREAERKDRWGIMNGEIITKETLEHVMALRAVLMTLQQYERAPGPHEGHREPCYYCGEKCNGLAGDPGEWPVPFCHADDPGRVKWHHDRCLQVRLQQYERLEAVVKAAREWVRCDCPRATPRLPTEQAIVDALAAIDASEEQS